VATPHHPGKESAKKKRQTKQQRPWKRIEQKVKKTE